MIYKYLKDSNINLASKLFGNLEEFNRKKCIHISHVYLQDFSNFDWFLIKKSENIPKMKDFDFIYTFLRANSDALITSGKIIRNHSNIYQDLINFGNYQDLELLSKRANKKIFDLDKKIISTKDKQIGIISRNFEKENILKSPIFQLNNTNKLIYTTNSNFNKLTNEILFDEKFKLFQLDNKINFFSEDNTKINNLIKHIQEKYQSQKFLIEMGKSINNFYENNDQTSNPIDCIVIILFKGIIDKSLIEGKFTNFSKLNLNYEIIHYSDSITDGFSNKWKVMVLERRQKLKVDKIVNYLLEEHKFEIKKILKK